MLHIMLCKLCFITNESFEQKNKGNIFRTEEVDAGAQAENPGNSESESESSQRSSTGKDFEMLDQDELYT